jgi:transcriptional regulator with XRE-family HTH domain
MKLAEKQKARELRQSGQSVREIAESLSVSRGTVSRWVHDIVLTDEQRCTLAARVGDHCLAAARVNRDSYFALRKGYQKRGRDLVKGCDKDFIAGIMLYWSEGGKSRNSVRFCNSDIDMVAFFARFLTKYLAVDKSKMKLSIRWFSGNGLTFEEIKDRWLSTLGLVDQNLGKCIVDYHGKTNSCSKKGKLPYGIGVLDVFDTAVVQMIYGAIQEYIGFENEAWIWNS